MACGGGDGGGGSGGGRAVPLDPKHDNDTVRSAAAMIFPFGSLGSTLMSRGETCGNRCPCKNRHLLRRGGRWKKEETACLMVFRKDHAFECMLIGLFQAESKQDLQPLLCCSFENKNRIANQT